MASLAESLYKGRNDTVKRRVFFHVLNYYYALGASDERGQSAPGPGAPGAFAGETPPAGEKGEVRIDSVRIGVLLKAVKEASAEGISDGLETAIEGLQGKTITVACEAFSNPQTDHLARTTTLEAIDELTPIIRDAKKELGVNSDRIKALIDAFFEVLKCETG